MLPQERLLEQEICSVKAYRNHGQTKLEITKNLQRLQNIVGSMLLKVEKYGIEETK